MKGDFFMVKKYAVLFIILAAVLWSLDGLLRRSLYTLPPTVVVLYEHILGFLLLLPFVLRKRRELTTFKLKDTTSFIWIALLSGVLGTVLYTTALGKVHYIQFSVVILLQKLQPLFVILAARLVLKEKITKSYLLWAFVALGGAYLLSFPQLTINVSRDSQTIIAALLAMGAAFCWGSSTAVSRSALLKYSPVITLAIRFVFTIPFALIAVFLLGAQASLMSVSIDQWLSLGAISVSTGLVAMVFYYQGLAHTQAKVSAIAELAWPISAVIIGFVFFGERLSITQWMGAIVLLFAMYKVTREISDENS